MVQSEAPNGGKCVVGATHTAEIEELKKSNEKQWEEIGNKASVSTMRWVVGISLILALAVVGFLWAQASAVRARLEAYQESLTGMTPGKEGILIQMRDMSIENNRLIKKHLMLSNQDADGNGNHLSPRTGK